jgi:superfamily II DNA/RNA helicase
MDYEDVTFVLQVGRASDREQYIHRLGRTARAGKEGYGLLLLAPHDESFLAALHDLPILPTSAPAAHGAAAHIFSFDFLSFLTTAHAAHTTTHTARAM